MFMCIYIYIYIYKYIYINIKLSLNDPIGIVVNFSSRSSGLIISF